jgi:hypothetical protein
MANPTQDPKYSWVYQELTKNDNGDFNLVNNVAYIIYKQRKIDFFKQFNGNPTPEQIYSFRELFMMESSLEGLRKEAGIIVTEILQNSLASKIVELEERFEQNTTSEMKRELEALKNTVSQSQSNLKGDLNTKHTAVMSELGKINEEGWGAWLKEIGKAVIITVLSTIALWLIFIASVKGTESQNKFTDRFLPTTTAPAASTPK